MYWIRAARHRMLIPVTLIVMAQGLAAAEPQTLNFRKLKVGDSGAFQPDGKGFVGLKVFQVLDEESMLVEVKYTNGLNPSTTYIAKVHTDTAGLVDDASWKPFGRVFEVEGTATYETVNGGSKTVFALREVPREQPSELTFRTWVDKNERFSIEAIYDGYEKGQVWLKKRDGKRLKIPINQLSEGDRDYAEATAKAKGDL